MRILVRGAGVAGLAVAHELASLGFAVDVRDVAPSIGAGASWLAGGMLAPWCERESADERVLVEGRAAADWWEAAVPGEVMRKGTLVVAPQRDLGELARFASRTSGYEWLGEDGIAELEPGLAGRFRKGLFFREEAHLDPRRVMQGLHRSLQMQGVRFHLGVADGLVECQFEPGQSHVPQDPLWHAGHLPHKGGEDLRHAPCLNWAAAEPRLMPVPLVRGRGRGRDKWLDLEGWRGAFDPDAIASDYHQIIDCTGSAMIGKLEHLRGVRGEMLYLQTEEIALSRPVRLLHPRHPIYIVPRQHGRFMVGATMIESDAGGSPSARSIMELLNAAYALHPAFGEARLIETGAGVRPAFPDNFPRVIAAGQVLHVNGLYRHGFLLAPAMARQVAELLATAEMKRTKAGATA